MVVGKDVRFPYYRRGSANLMEASGCEICRNIPDFAAADLTGGETLPEAALVLVDANPHPDGFWDTSKDYEITKRCPVCGGLYTYKYHYEFSVGYIEASAWIERRGVPGMRGYQACDARRQASGEARGQQRHAPAPRQGGCYAPAKMQGGG